MDLINNITDWATGGKNKEAADALKRAEGYFSGIQAPTVQQLTLPELQKYVEAGVMTPAEAQAYLQSSNAYNSENVDQTGTGAQVAALNRLSQVADAGPNGTPTEQAQIENAIQKMNTNTGGQRGAIEQAMAARGTPYALIQGALENQTVGQEGQQAHMDAVNAQANAYQQALTAMAQGGQLGSSLQGQQNAQANTVAGAQNAMQQFNAANQQQNAQFNAGNQQQANAANAANRQQVSNNNVGNANARTQYNAGLSQQVFNDQVQKAQGMAGAATNSANLNQQQGQQNAGTASGVVNLVSSFLGAPTGGAQMGSAGHQENAAYNWQPGQPGYAHGGIVDHDHSICMAHGGYCMADGGQVPGQAPFPGDTTQNDIVHADLSPGEAVIPRSTVQQNPDVVASLLDAGGQGDVIDPMDVATILKAMRAMRMGAM